MLLQERYFQSHNDSSIYNATIVNLRPYSSAFFLSDGYTIMWPKMIDDEIGLFNIRLSNIPAHLNITGIHAEYISGSIYLYVSCSPLSHITDRRCHFFVYNVNCVPDSEFQSEICSLQLIQDIRICYRALDIQAVTVDNTRYLLVTGCDKDIHIYEIETTTGEVKRSERRDNLKAIWSARLGFSKCPNIPLLIRIDECDTASQGVVGYADGHLYLYKILTNSDIEIKIGTIPAANSRVPQESINVDGRYNPYYQKLVTSDSIHESSISSEATITEEVKSFASLPPHQINQETNYTFLFDGTILALCYYTMMNKLHSTTTNISPYILIGLSTGEVFLFDLNSYQCSDALFSGAVQHGAVQAITIGDVTMNGTNDVLLGFEDGTLLLYEQVPIEILSDTTDTPYSSDLMSTIRFREIWSNKLPFPILGLYFGEFLNNSNPILSTDSNITTNNNASNNNINNNKVVLYLPQLYVITSHSIHIFILSDQSTTLNGSNSKLSSSVNGNAPSSSSSSSITAMTTMQTKTMLIESIVSHLSQLKTSLLKKKQSDRNHSKIKQMNEITNSNTTITTTTDNNNMNKNHRKSEVNFKDQSEEYCKFVIQQLIDDLVQNIVETFCE